MGPGRMLSMLALSLVVMLQSRVTAVAGPGGLHSSPSVRSQVADDSVNRLAEILNALPGADSAIVTRAGAPAHAAPRERDVRPMREPWSHEGEFAGRPGREWRERLARTLGNAPILQQPRTASIPGDSLIRWIIQVRVYQGPRLRRIMLRLAERCALIRDNPYAVILDIAPTAQALLDLAREALPQDQWLQTAALPPVAVPQPTPPAPIVVVPPTSDELPKFGEYVYVEELPEAIQKVQPVIPPAARASGIAGTVMVQVLVGKDGLVEDVRVVKSIPELDGAAIDCARQWRFKPALSHNEPVAVWVAIPLKF